MAVNSGCAVHYHNHKSVVGKARDIQTPYGKIDNLVPKFYSSLDFWFPWKMKESKTNEQ